MQTIDEAHIKKWARTFLDDFLEEHDSLIDLYICGQTFNKEELKIFVDELLSRENKKKATGISLIEKDLDDDCIRELCRLEWLEDLEVPANNLSNKAINQIVKYLPNLKRLVISGNPNITDISKLQKLTQLEELFASNLPLQMDSNDFIMLVGKTKLRALVIRDSNVDERTLKTLEVGLLKNSVDAAYLNNEHLEEEKH